MIVAILVDRRDAVVAILIDGGREILGRRAILALDDAAAVAAACLIDERIAVFGPLLDRRIIVVAGELPDIGDRAVAVVQDGRRAVRSEEHTSELQSLMRNSYAVFCLKKKK